MDRNPKNPMISILYHWSLSARRAWIEIIDDIEPSTTRRVALRKESVDRNFHTVQIVIIVVVALRKESVDRNPVNVMSVSAVQGRSPQGERG